MYSIQEGTIEDFQDVYRMMLGDFPKEEIREFQELQKNMDSQNYKLYLLKEENSIIGYAFVYEIDMPKSCWLDYLAVSKKYRGAGYGSNMLKEIKEIYRDSLGMFIEIEKPESEDEMELLLQKKRISFYESLGAKKFNFEYGFPTGSGSIPLQLYFMPYKEVDVIEGEKIKMAVDQVFTSLYSGIKNAMEVLEEFKDKIKDESF